jgi:hypothetical protein
MNYGARINGSTVHPKAATSMNIGGVTTTATGRSEGSASPAADEHSDSALHQLLFRIVPKLNSDLEKKPSSSRN